MAPPFKGTLLERLQELSHFIRYGSYRTASIYAMYRSRLPIDEKTVLLEAYHGARMSCVPYALFQAMLDDPDCAGFTFVWTFNPHDDGENLIHNRYKNRSNVKFCRRHSRLYLKTLASAKYLINNKTFHHYFAKRPGQVHLSSWHATAFKTLGKDQYGSMGQYGNVTRNYLQTDYLVMPNRFTADVLLDSCDVRSLFPGVVVDAGYPRSDLTRNTDPAAMKRQLVDMLGIDPDKRIVLYAPTWRGEVGSVIDTTDVIVDSITGLAAGLPEGYELLLKVHDRTYAYAKENPSLQSLANVPDWFETNELLAAVDVLITDYSSICFDFLCLRRPIIHFVFDRSEYERTRGLYFDMETEMAGPLCYTADEVNAAIADIDAVAERYREPHEKLIDLLAYNEDGACSKRVLDIVLRGQQLDHAYRVEDTEKTRVLVWAGDIDARSERLVQGLSSLDHDRLDVSLLFDGAPGNRDEYYITRLDPRIKVFYRAESVARKLASRGVDLAGSDSTASKYLSPDAAARWREELFGAIDFDVAVDMSGAASVFQLIFAHTQFSKKVVFMPGPYRVDIRASSPEFLARHFDVLVCTSQNHLDYYARKLADTEGEHKLVLVPLPADIDGFLERASGDVSHLIAGVDHCVDCAARSLDPYCETSDLLFEFRVGGLTPANLSAVPGTRAALDEFATALRTASSVLPGASEDAERLAGFARLFSVEGRVDR